MEATLSNSTQERKLKTNGNEMVYWASINIIIINIIVYVLVLTYKSISEDFLTVGIANTVLILIGVSLSVLCLILWVGHVTSIHEIGSFFAKAIWVGFIASMLTTSVGAYRLTMKAAEQKHLKIESFVLLDESQIKIRPSNGKSYEKLYLEDFTVKSSDVFRLMPSVRIPLFISVSGHKLDESRRCNVTAQVALIEEAVKHHIARPPVVRDENDWVNANIPSSLPKVTLTGLKEANKNKVVFLGIFEFKISKKGIYTLRITIQDEDNKKYDVQECNVTIN